MFLGTGVILLSVILGIEAQRSVSQKKASWTKSKGKSVIFDCEATGLSSGDYVHWYQKKEGEPFKRVLYISYNAGSTTKDNDHPQNADFSVFLMIEAQSVSQKKASWTKSKGKSVIFDCEATGLSSGNYVHWYQKKEGEPFKRVLYISYDTGSTTKDNDHPQNADFSGEKSGNAYKLKIST
ncbi:hypothetical protein AGOR_G00040790 [Albula goreensis]|uniref:Ig-like domain-containing protein n=1 Tax=Albula goreensis TaxID=1534307 RepID=A0A8T3E1D5_9TELE|nr:hypothetical protein AGOR_G00040790 [Albula goreensis]